MKYKTNGTCASMIDVEVKDGRIESVTFTGGCNGNGKAVAKLVTGRPVDEVVSILAGNDCKGRGTSCADQLTIALRQAQEEARALA
jgi:uncharacterized protein (TIGR03905 family)